jgi:6-phosphogluconate dehydrogenase
MENKNLKKLYEIGMVGLGVMGRNLSLNMADHGFSVAGYDKDPAKVESLRKEAENRDIHCTDNLQNFISNLRLPRTVILLVPAGAPVDSVINELSPHLKKNDLIIDSGNSYFKDTNLRTIRLKDKGILFMGMGISGGAEGARHGASIMPGGLKEAYDRVKPVLEAVAAKGTGCLFRTPFLWFISFGGAKEMNIILKTIYGIDPLVGGSAPLTILRCSMPGQALLRGLSCRRIQKSCFRSI